MKVPFTSMQNSMIELATGGSNIDIVILIDALPEISRVVGEGGSLLNAWKSEHLDDTSLSTYLLQLWLHRQWNPTKCQCPSRHMRADKTETLESYCLKTLSKLGPWGQHLKIRVQARKYSSWPGLFENWFLIPGPDFRAQPGLLWNLAWPGPIHVVPGLDFVASPVPRWNPAQPSLVLQILENHSFPSFVCCRAGGSISKTHVFCIHLICSMLNNSLICFDLGLGSMLENLILKNAVDFTLSQMDVWSSSDAQLRRFS